MNLRQTETGEEAKTKAQAWYHNPETPLPQPLITATQAPVSTQEPLPAPSPALFEPSAAERILARAGALQEVHGQMLSQEPMEAVAHEIGIKPEFVRLAIEQENAVVLSPLHPVLKTTQGQKSSAKTRTAVIASVGMSLAYGGLVPALLSPVYRPDGYWCFAFLFPALLALIYGLLCRSRRAGAAAGAILAGIVLFVVFIGFGLLGNSVTMPLSDQFAVVAIIASGALLGAAGAQARRVVSRRQTSNRIKPT
ncbi:MAG: hypothetical protein V4671_26585 [Armatimonadota bacterium]